MSNYGRSNLNSAVSVRKFDILYDALSMIYQENTLKINSHFKKKELANMRILVAEDEKINFLVINFLLKDKVGKVDRAINGKEAIELARTNDYDLILMDINMPLMGGQEATKIIRKLFPNLPIIAQTAYTYEDEKIKLLDAGCNDVIFKPIKKELLFEVLQKYASN